MATTEVKMDFKQAQSEMRAMVRALRAFENVSAVLKAAADAHVATENAEEKLVGILQEIEGIETNLSAGRAKATEEQRVAAVEMERLRDVYFTREATFKNEAEQTAKARERAANEMSTAAELIASGLQAECAVLEEKRDGLTKAVAKAQAEWDAMRKRMGVD